MRLPRIRPSWRAEALVAVLLLAVPVTAQLTTPAAAPARPAGTVGVGPVSAYNGTVWVRLNSTHTPLARTQAAFAYDYADGYALMFGGQNQNPKGVPYFGDTWIFRDDQWTQLHPKVSPPARRGAMMAYDIRDGYVVLFGGSNATQFFNDTWEFRNGKWTELFPSQAPSPRRSAGMVYDATDQYVLLYGGHGGNASLPEYSPLYHVYADTWEFVGGQWTRLHPQGSPPADTEPFLAYDPSEGYTVLYGGYNQGNRSGSEYTMNWTWTYARGSWSNISSLEMQTPTWRDGGYLEFDPLIDGLYMFGGDDLIAPVISTYAFVAGQWQELSATSAPPDRAADRGAWDPAMNFLVTFGSPYNATTGVVTGPATTWANELP